jgi:hypothetical protein
LLFGNDVQLEGERGIMKRCNSTILHFAAFWWSGDETLLTGTSKIQNDISEEEILKGHKIMT